MKHLWFVLAALFLTGCFSGTIGPFDSFSHVEGIRKDLPPEPIARIRQDLSDLATQRERAAGAVIVFWESMQTKYRNYLIAPRDPEILMSQIEELVENYRAYPYKSALTLELREQQWPYGLEGWKTAMAQAAGGPPAVLSGVRRTQAAQACPLWVERFTEPPATPPARDSGTVAAWVGTYLNQLEQIHLFWISANLAMEMQKDYINRIEMDTSDRFRNQQLATRSTYSLPMTTSSADRLKKLDYAFSQFPGYQKERKRFQSIGGPTPWQLPREHLYGAYNVWTVILYTSAEGYEYLSEGVYREGPEKIAATRVYLQEGFAHMILSPLWLPMPLIAKASSERQSTIAGQTEPHEKTGGLFAIWPLYIYGDGTFFLLDQEKAHVFAAGVPIAYAFGKVEAENGQEIRMHTLLNGNLYTGGVWTKPNPDEKIRVHSSGPFACLWLSAYSNRPGQGYAHLVGAWGALWTSMHNKDELSERHGVLYGLFGWGKNRHGDQVIRLFGIPFRTGK